MSKNGKADTIPADSMVAFPSEILSQLAPIMQVRADLDRQIGAIARAYAIGKGIDLQAQNMQLTPDGAGYILSPV